MNRTHSHPTADTACDVLLVHAGVPRVGIGYAGLFKLLQQQGVNARLVRFDATGGQLAQLRSLRGVKLIGFSIHWHPQLHVSLKLAEHLRTLPNLRRARTVVGGITASCFADELIAHPAIDFVIKGDGEVALPLLVQHVLGDSIALSDIPNLRFKEQGVARRSAIVHRTDERTLCDLESLVIPDGQLHASTGGVLAYGRGCAGKCPYCGGQAEAFATWGDGPVLERSAMGVRSVLRKATPTGSLYLLCDYDGRSEFIAECLEGVEHDAVGVCCTGLPTMDSIRRIMTAPGGGLRKSVCWEISPEVGIDSLRDEIRSHTFTNKELVALLDECFQEFPHGTVLLFFSFFQPGEDVLRVETRKFIAQLLARYLPLVTSGRLVLLDTPLSTDPAAPIQQGRVSGMSCDVHTGSDYTREMLAWNHNDGNLLLHRPAGVDRDRAALLNLFFHYEEDLRRTAPTAYLRLVESQPSFEAYDEFARQAFGRFHATHLTDLLQSHAAEQFTGSAQSLLGFHYDDDGGRASHRLRHAWLSALLAGLPPSAASASPAASRARAAAEQELAFARTRAAFDGAASAWRERPPHFHELLEGQGRKIELIIRSRPRLPPLTPVRGRFVELAPIKTSTAAAAGWATLSYRGSLSMLGRDYFAKLLRSMEPNRLPQPLRAAVPELGEADLRRARRGSQRAWYALLKGDDAVARTMCTALLEAHAPLAEICDALGVPRDCLLRSDDLELDPLQVSRICNWPAVVEVDVDPRLVVLLTNVLRRQCLLRADSPAARGVNGSFVCHHLFRPDVAGTRGVWSLVTLLGTYQAELLQSCDGVSSLTRLAERHPGPSPVSLGNAMGELYARQLVL